MPFVFAKERSAAYMPSYFKYRFNIVTMMLCRFTCPIVMFNAQIVTLMMPNTNTTSIDSVCVGFWLFVSPVVCYAF